MSSRLKQIRGKAGLSQIKVAERVGVSQPTYQRWESGSAPVPKGKLRKLAEALDTTPEFLAGRHAPIKAELYSEKEDDKAGYWGEAAFHFVGGGDPLLLTISDHSYSRLFADLQGDEKFFTVRSMANQTVVFRRSAIKDVYLSSEAYDYFGPKGVDYPHFKQIMVPDERDWAIIEALEIDVAYDEGFADEDIERVSNMIQMSDDQLEALVKGGHIKAEELEKKKEASRERTALFFSLACETVWQFSGGERRIVNTAHHDTFYDGLRDLIDFDEFAYLGGFLVMEDVPGHRTIFLNPDNIDYLSVPTHSYEATVAETEAEEADEDA